MGVCSTLHAIVFILISYNFVQVQIVDHILKNWLIDISFFIYKYNVAKKFPEINSCSIFGKQIQKLVQFIEPGYFKIIFRSRFSNYHDLYIAGADPGGGARAPGAPPPPKIGKNMMFWRKIVIFHTKYPKNFAPPSAMGKNMIFWRIIVIFHTKFPH